MIALYTAPSFQELPSISPPCLELETWLRMAKLPYKKVIVTARFPFNPDCIHPLQTTEKENVSHSSHVD